MTDKEANKILDTMLFAIQDATYEQRKDVFKESGYPKLSFMFEEWAVGNDLPQVFIDKAMSHIKTANTKLYKVLK